MHCSSKLFPQFQAQNYSKKKNIFRDEHSSLFCRSVNDEKKLGKRSLPLPLKVESARARQTERQTEESGPEESMEPHLMENTLNLFFQLCHWPCKQSKLDRVYLENSLKCV